MATPGDYVVIYASTTNADSDVLRNAFTALQKLPSNVTLIPIDKSSLGLLNEGDFISINNRKAEPLDQVAYSPDWHHPLLVETRGVSLERRSLDAPVWLRNNWGSTVHPAGGTPGLPNSIAQKPEAQDIKAGVHIYPETFSPDGDGIHDTLEIRLADLAPSSLIDVTVFDLQGRPVRQVARSMFAGSTPILFWDGYDNDGQQLPIGIYIIWVSMLDTSAGTHHTIKRPAVLARPL